MKPNNWSTYIPLWGSFKLMVNSSGHIQIPMKSIQRLSWIRIPGSWGFKYPYQCNLVTKFKRLPQIFCNSWCTFFYPVSIKRENTTWISFSDMYRKCMWNSCNPAHICNSVAFTGVYKSQIFSCYFQLIFVGCPIVGLSSIFSLVPEQARQVTDFWIVNIKAQK